MQTRTYSAGHVQRRVAENDVDTIQRLYKQGYSLEQIHRKTGRTIFRIMEILESRFSRLPSDEDDAKPQSVERLSFARVKEIEKRLGIRREGGRKERALELVKRRLNDKLTLEQLGGILDAIYGRE